MRDPLPAIPTEDRNSKEIRPAVLGYDAAARYIGMSRSWLEHSNITRVRQGTRVGFLIADLDNHLAANRDRDVA